ncbi:MAG TPA: hypothetical protein PLN69_00700 [bacterium]|nr:hypothetical protein [bacterium]
MSFFLLIIIAIAGGGAFAIEDESFISKQGKVEINSSESVYDNEEISIRTQIYSVALFKMAGGAEVTVFPEAEASIRPGSDAVDIRSGSVFVCSREFVTKVDVSGVVVDRYMGRMRVSKESGNVVLEMLDGSASVGAGYDQFEAIKGDILVLSLDGSVQKAGKISGKELHKIRHKLMIYRQSMNDEGPFSAGKLEELPVLEDGAGCIEVCPIE